MQAKRSNPNKSNDITIFGLLRRKCLAMPFASLVLLILLLNICLINCIPAYSSEYRVLINIPSRTLELWNGSKIEKIYKIGVGRPDFPTPIGNFKVITRIKNPTWENPYKPAGYSRIRPGAHNPLGTRWIGFYRDKKSGEYGMHGTNNPLSLGKYSSHGCIRMRISDAEEIFNKLDYGTPVKVSYYTHRLIIKNNKLIIKKYPHKYKRKISPEKMIKEQLSTLYNYNLDEKQLKKAYKLPNGLSITIGETKHTEDKESIFQKISNFCFPN